MLLQVECSIQNQDSEADSSTAAEISDMQDFSQKSSNISAAQHQNQIAEQQKKIENVNHDETDKLMNFFHTNISDESAFSSFDHCFMPSQCL